MPIGQAWYAGAMQLKHVRAFAQRNWAGVAQAKRAYLAAQAHEDEAAWAFWASQSLFEHMRSLEPSFPAGVEHDGGSGRRAQGHR